MAHTCTSLSLSLSLSLFPAHTHTHSVAVSTATQVSQEPPHTLWEKINAKQVNHLLAGGAAGAVSRTSVSPLERMKILYQVSPVHIITAVVTLL